MENKLETQEKRGDPLFNKDAMTLVLSVDPSISYSNRLQNIAKQRGLSRKEELHITLIGRETGEIIKEHLNKSFGKEKERLLLTMQKLVQNFNWSFIPQQEFYFISKEYVDSDYDDTLEKRQSCVQLVNLPDLEEFYRQLNQLLNLNLEIPFPHITLFTTSTSEDKKLRGIGVYSKTQFENMTPEKLTF